MSETVHVESMPASRRAFYSSRLASFLAFAPLTLWTIGHVWNGLAVYQGKAEWEHALTDYTHPVAMGVTLIVVLLPLVIHTVWGLARIFAAQPNNGRYNFYGNLKFILQRLSALGLLAFLCAHVYIALIKPRMLEGHAESLEDLAGYMRYHLPTLLVYLLGTLAVAYHMANGLQTFCMGWGIATSRKALMRLDRLVLVFFVLFLAMCWASIYGLWQVGATFGPPQGI